MVEYSVELRWLVAGTMLLWQAPSLAQSADELALLYGDEESVTIATGSSKPVHLAPSVASVITAEDIAAHGATDLDQVLEMVPGLHVSLSFNRLNSIYSIRGIHTGQNPQVLMLLDGVPINQYLTGGRPNTFRLPVAAIARVEVMRGPGSAIYGADAFAGVINVITKKADDVDGTHVGGGYGSFATRNGWAQYGGSLGDWTMSGTVQWLKSDGDSGRVVNSDLQSALDTAFGTSASLAPGALSTRYDILDTHLNLTREHWNINLWNWRQSDGGVGPGAAQALDPSGRSDEDDLLFDVSYGTNDWLPQWEVTTRATYHYLKDSNRFDILPAGATVLICPDGNLCASPSASVVNFPDGVLGSPVATERGYGLQVTGVYSGWQLHTLRLASGVIRQFEQTREAKNFGPGVIDGTVSPINGTLTDVTGTANIYMADQTRNLWFVSAQDEWQMAPDWQFTVGGRYDRYSDFGSTTNPRIALVWSTRQNLTTKLLYGQAFRAPSLSELYFINNPALIGNRNLQPESIQTREIALDYRPTLNSQVGLSLFRYDAKNLIDFVYDPATASQIAQNTAGQTGYGFEVEANWNVTDKMRLFGNYASQRSAYKADGSAVPDAPGQQLYVGAEWEFVQAWRAAVQANWVADRARAAGDTRAAVADYSLVNLTLRHADFGGEWEFLFSVHNLFDVTAYEPSDPSIAGDYPLAGRSLYAQAAYHFR